MSQHYSNPKNASDPHKLPDIEIFELTAREVVEMDEELMWEVRKRFPLSSMNSIEREKGVDWAIEEEGIEGGWFWWNCFPGCLPEGAAIGPFHNPAQALSDAMETFEEGEL